MRNIQDDQKKTILVVEASRANNGRDRSRPVPTASEQNLEALRQSIDAIDEQIVQLIGERFQLVRKIKAVKRDAKLEVLDPEREAKLLLRLNELSRKYSVPLEVIIHIYDFLMEQSRQIQKH